jgi:hypothetical protein
MNKKTNTILFILGATVFNLITMAILFFVPLLILLMLFRENLGSYFGILTIFLFIGALVGSFVIYGFVMKRISAKVDMDKYFEPIFRKKKT